MPNLVIVKNNQIAFSRHIRRMDDSICTIAPEDLFFKGALIFPITEYALDIEAAIDKPKEHSFGIAVTELAGVVLSANGRLHEFSFDEGGLRRKSISYGDKALYVRSNLSSLEETAWAAVKLTDTLEEALDLIHKTLAFDRRNYKIMDLVKVADGLSEIFNKPTVPEIKE